MDTICDCSSSACEREAVTKFKSDAFTFFPVGELGCGDGAAAALGLSRCPQDEAVSTRAVQIEGVVASYPAAGLLSDRGQGDAVESELVAVLDCFLVELDVFARRENAVGECVLRERDGFAADGDVAVVESFFGESDDVGVGAVRREAEGFRLLIIGVSFVRGGCLPACYFCARAGVGLSRRVEAGVGRRGDRAAANNEARVVRSIYCRLLSESEFVIAADGESDAVRQDVVADE